MDLFKSIQKMFPSRTTLQKFLIAKKGYCTLLVGTMLLTGCALTHPTDPYASISPWSDNRVAHHNMPQHPEPEARDRSIPLQEPLTITRAVQIALINNPEIAATRWDVASAEQRQQAVQAGRRPTLNAEMGLQHFLDDQRLIPARYNGEPGIFDRDMYRSDLVLRMPLFTGGRITHEIHAAKLLSLAEERRLARSREELVFNVSGLFYSMLSRHEVIRSLEFSTTAMEEHHKKVSDLPAVQKAAQVDLLRTEVRLADLRQSLVQEQNILAAQKRLLVSLMGVDDQADQIAIVGMLATEPDLGPTEEDMVSTAMKRRADYLAARNLLEAQARRVDAARAEHWPTFSLLAAYGVRGTGSGESEDVGVVGVGITVPLLDAGRTTARVEQERATLGAARERLRKLELQIRREVETAALDIRSSAQRIDATRPAIEQARESLRIERMKYDLGSGSLTDVLDAQSALLQSETTHARALAEYHIARAKLKLAIGDDSL